MELKERMEDKIGDLMMLLVGRPLACDWPGSWLLVWKGRR